MEALTGASVSQVQLLAEALALEFSQSRASELCASALRRLLPGLDYLSIAATNPAQAGCIVASANCAMEGPTTLHLHDARSSLVGLALTSSQPVQLSLVDSAASKAFLAWSDVQQMVAQAPAASHLLCIPFGCAEEPADTANEAETTCQQHASSGSSSGALLFGLTEPPNLDARRAALLALLARCLPAPMARLSGDTLAFVNFACGNKAECTCCCQPDSEEEEEEEESGENDSCMRGGPGGDGRDASGPSQALPVPLQEEAGFASAFDNSSGPSDWWAGDKKLLGSQAAHKAAAAAAAPPTQQPGFCPPHNPSPPEARSFYFSKALVTAAEEDHGVVAQHPLTLTFRSPLAEQEYGQWVAQHHLKRGDMVTSVLLLSAVALVAFLRPYQLVDTAPGSLALGVGMALPLLLSWLNHANHMSLRLWVVGALRLYAVTFINSACIRSFQSHLAPDQARQWLSFWRLTGVESLCVTGLGFRMPLRLSLLLQLAALGIVLWNLPHMCSQSFPGMSPAACFQGSAVTAALFGYLVPILGLRCMEQRSRAAFAGQLRAAAAHQS